MPWQFLGTVSPTQLDWKRFATPVTGGELFRVRQSWVGDWPGTGYLQFSAVYSGAGRHGFRKVGADTEARIISLAIPQALLEAGLTTRHIECRLNPRARPYAVANWQVSIDYWKAGNSVAIGWMITDVWDTGFSAEVMLTNNGQIPVSDWLVRLDTANITETWGAELAAIDADTWEVSPSLTANTGEILPGETVRFGFVGTGSPNLDNLTLVSTTLVT